MIFCISKDKCKDPAKSTRTLDEKQNNNQEDHCNDITSRKRKSGVDLDGDQNEQGDKLYAAKKPRVCFQFPQIKHR